MKKIGIVADNYKVEQFKKEFKAAGIGEADVKYTPNGKWFERTTSITYEMPDEEFIKAKRVVADIVQKVNQHFIALNVKNKPFSKN